MLSTMAHPLLTKYKLQGINLHVIFSNVMTVILIENSSWSVFLSGFPLSLVQLYLSVIHLRLEPKALKSKMGNMSLNGQY